MKQLVNDVYLGGFSVINVLNERSAWAASFKYFTVGEIQLTDDSGQEIGVEKPHELSFDGTYALKLNESFSMGVSLRYIRSDFALKVSNSNIKTVNTFGVDISGYYNSEEMNFGDFNGIILGGFNISNIGPKVNYTDGGRESFIPTNMKLGAGFDFILDDYNKVGLTFETNKLLVPTPQPDHSEADKSFMEGIFSSFGDAPGGTKEELQEFTWGVGTEYMYDNVFGVRAGYFHESEYKGGRKYFTLGLGVKFKSAQVDLSYLFNASDINNPLENTLRFSLAFNLGEDYTF
jgi:long-subunit fatty acid transport protein